MARADEYLSLLDDVAAPPPDGDHPADAALKSILVHLACADGVVQEEEFEFFERVLPGMDAAEILAWVAESAAEDLDFDDIADCLHDDDERQGALRFAARLAWADKVLETHEKVFLMRLNAAMGLPSSAVEEALSAVIGAPTGDVDATKVERAMEGMRWQAATPEKTGLLAELSAVVPPDAHPVARLLVENTEQVGLYDKGLAASFVEGPRFIPWSEVATYTRVPVFGAALRVMTKNGETWTVRDPRLREVGTLMDRVYTEHD